MSKQELRKVYLEKRLSLSSQDYANSNGLIVENFFSRVDLLSTKVLHTFLPIERSNEPDTWLIINRVQSVYPHIRISLPRINDETGELESIFFEGREQLVINKWGIPQPHQGKKTRINEIDMVLVPLLIFDKQGHRVGYGKGYYDKFLSTCRVDCKRIGISLFEPVDRIDDVNDLDVAIQYCVTPSTVYQF
jgi:5-formyltetrahydrofolate cyclo-ligase